ncbi:hypothetical protein ABEG17_16345 [Pedococcus sp. KACC 23699]|uniref:Uncharacterized protein n=1 Tax=Pedococcus sp. KACC 23699 TaxID=3149228 RepID=A0AAU7JSH1_9MICO
MGWVKLLGCMAIAFGVGRYVTGLRHGRWGDAFERDLVACMLLAWIGVALVVGAVVA